jgi:hypothetical protein
MACGGLSSDLWDESFRRCFLAFDPWEAVAGLRELPPGLGPATAVVRELPSDGWERTSGLREPSGARWSAIRGAVLTPGGDEGAPIGHFQASTRDVLDAIGPMLDAIVDLAASIEEMETPRRPLKEATRQESDGSARMAENRGRA